MKRLAMACALAAAMLAAAVGPARADCKLQALAVIPITFVNDSPMVEVSLNGKPALMRFSWAYVPQLWNTSVAKYGLDALRSTDTVGYGMGGSSHIGRARVAEFEIGGVKAKDIDFQLVEDDENVQEAGSFGLALAGFANLSYDIEFDFPHSTVRVFNPQGCKGSEVVYWGGEYATLNAAPNGWFDIRLGDKMVSGALVPGNEVTFLTAPGASRVGIPLQAAGPLPMGMIAGGVVKPIEVSIAALPDVKIGDETIKRAALAVGDIYVGDHMSGGIDRPELVLGSDFARSHRIYLAVSQRKMYFSYQGGPVFTNIYKRLGADPPPPVPDAPAAPPKP